MESSTLMLPHEKFCGPRFRLRVRFCVRERRRRRNGIGEPSLPLQQFSRLYMYEETHAYMTFTLNLQTLFKFREEGMVTNLKSIYRRPIW